MTMLELTVNINTDGSYSIALSDDDLDDATWSRAYSLAVRELQGRDQQRREITEAALVAASSTNDTPAETAPSSKRRRASA